MSLLSVHSVSSCTSPSTGIVISIVVVVIVIVGIVVVTAFSVVVVIIIIVNICSFLIIVAPVSRVIFWAGCVFKGT